MRRAERPAAVWDDAPPEAMLHTCSELGTSGAGDWEDPAVSAIVQSVPELG